MTVSHQRVPILVYHHVYADADAQRAGKVQGVIALSEFVRHMRFIRDEGWTVVSTSDLIDWLTVAGSLPKRACVIHFDNGWQDTYTIAQPVLAEFGFTATCFPITSGVDAASANKSAAVRTLTEGWVEKPFMTWSQVASLHESDWQIGAHTHTHCKIADKHTSEGDDAVLWEAHTSNERFEKELGFCPEHFAYPSGSRNDRTDELLAGIYRSLRLWHWQWPIQWTFTEQTTSTCGVHCQNIDALVPMDDFQRIFYEAAGEKESAI